MYALNQTTLHKIKSTPAKKIITMQELKQYCALTRILNLISHPIYSASV